MGLHNGELVPGMVDRDLCGTLKEVGTLKAEGSGFISQV